MNLVVQNIVQDQYVPDDEDFYTWANLLAGATGDAEVTIRIVDVSESQSLNLDYRGKDAPTNVLSFPMDSFGIPDIAESILGDIVICAEVVNREAHEQGKDKAAHWAHITLHGFLHLLGYDHIEDIDANKMESYEIELLDKLGFSNPYN
jgi:probable rRNA maturation factor